jgi:hypothetical protein
MENDFDAYFDAEVVTAERSRPDQLFHYPNFEAAIFGILASGTLRLSPFESTNDLWESRPLHPCLTSHFDEQPPVPGFQFWNEIDINLRPHSKVTCPTQDWDLPEGCDETQGESGSRSLNSTSLKIEALESVGTWPPCTISNQ